MRLTPTEASILRHRLDVSDNIAEALTDTADGMPPSPFAYDDIITACERILSALPEVVGTEPIDLAIIDDAVDGSTYLDAMEYEVCADATAAEYAAELFISPGKFAAHVKAFATLRRKVEAYIADGAR